MFFRRNVDDEFADLFRGMDRLSRTFFEDPVRSFAPALPAAASGSGLPALRSWWGDTPLPAVESFTRDGRLVLRAELPGVNREDVEVTVDNGRLILRGEKKFEDEREETDYHVRERRYGRFERSFTLPEGVDADKVEARMTDGVLEISMPAETTARRIAIGPGSKSNKSRAA